MYVPLGIFFFFFCSTIIVLGPELKISPVVSILSEVTSVAHPKCRSHTECVGALGSIVHPVALASIQANTWSNQRIRYIVMRLTTYIYPCRRSAHTGRGFIFLDIHRSRGPIQRTCGKQFSRMLDWFRWLISWALCFRAHPSDLILYYLIWSHFLLAFNNNLYGKGASFSHDYCHFQLQLNGEMQYFVRAYFRKVQSHTNEYLHSIKMCDVVAKRYSNYL